MVRNFQVNLKTYNSSKWGAKPNFDLTQMVPAPTTGTGYLAQLQGISLWRSKDFTISYKTACKIKNPERTAFVV